MHSLRPTLYQLLHTFFNVVPHASKLAAGRQAVALAVSAGLLVVLTGMSMLPSCRHPAVKAVMAPMT